MINKLILVGHVGKKPEIRRTQDGKPVATLSLATTERWRDKATGEKREHTTWHRVVIFNEKLCEVAEKFIDKGSRVYCEGPLKNREWTDKDGVKRFVSELVMSGFNCQLTLLDKSDREFAPAAEPSDYGNVPSSSTSQPATASSAGKRDLDDDIPF